MVKKNHRAKYVPVLQTSFHSKVIVWTYTQSQRRCNIISFIYVYNLLFYVQSRPTAFHGRRGGR